MAGAIPNNLLNVELVKTQAEFDAFVHDYAIDFNENNFIHIGTYTSTNNLYSSYRFRIRRDMINNVPVGDYYVTITDVGVGVGVGGKRKRNQKNKQSKKNKRKSRRTRRML